MLKLSGDKLKREGLITDLFNLFENFGNQNGRGINSGFPAARSLLSRSINAELFISIIVSLFLF